MPQHHLVESERQRSQLTPGFTFIFTLGVTFNIHISAALCYGYQEKRRSSLSCWGEWCYIEWKSKNIYSWLTAHWRHTFATWKGHRASPMVPQSGARWLRFLVNGVEKPFCEFPQLSRGSLGLLLQPHVVLSQVLDFSLQNGLVLFFLDEQK